MPRTGLTQPRQGLSQPLARSMPSVPSGPSGPGAPRSQPGPASGARNSSQTADLRRVGVTQPITTLTRNAPVSGSAQELTPEELLALEQALSKFIGPMARIVLKKEVARNAGAKNLVNALTTQLDQQDQRDAFLQAAKKALPRRSL